MGQAGQMNNNLPGHKKVFMNHLAALPDILLNQNQLRKGHPDKGAISVMSNNTCQQFLPCAWVHKGGKKVNYFDVNNF
jgi:hypothetical protein